jgi:hypothetical protein
MAKKDREVDTIKHRSGIEAIVYFNPNPPRHDQDGLTFWTKVGDKMFKAKSAAELFLQVDDYLNKNSKLDWHPVIKISELKPWNVPNPDKFVGFEIERFYLAMTSEVNRDKKRIIRQTEWDVYNFDEDCGGFSKESFDKLGPDMFRIARSTVSYEFDCEIPGGLPYRDHGHDQETFLLAYDESLWAALQTIQEGIARLKHRLRDLTGTPDGIKMLGQMGSQLLNLLPEIKTEKPKAGAVR